MNYFIKSTNNLEDSYTMIAERMIQSQCIISKTTWNMALIGLLLLMINDKWSSNNKGTQ